MGFLSRKKTRPRVVRTDGQIDERTNRRTSTYTGWIKVCKLFPQGYY